MITMVCSGAFKKRKRNSSLFKDSIFLGLENYKNLLISLFLLLALLPVSSPSRDQRDPDPDETQIHCPEWRPPYGFLFRFPWNQEPLPCPGRLKRSAPHPHPSNSVLGSSLPGTMLQPHRPSVCSCNTANSDLSWRPRANCSSAQKALP